MTRTNIDSPLNAASGRPTDVRPARAFTAVIAVLFVLAGITVGQATLVPARASVPVANGGETFFADSYRANNAPNPTTYSAGALNPGQMYQVTLDGTFSYYYAAYMSNPSTRCGTPSATVP